MDYISVLADPIYVAKFQKFCGVELVKPDTCDQQTQTRGQSSDSEDSEKSYKINNDRNDHAQQTTDSQSGQPNKELNGHESQTNKNNLFLGSPGKENPSHNNNNIDNDETHDAHSPSDSTRQRLTGRNSGSQSQIRQKGDISSCKKDNLSSQEEPNSRVQKQAYVIKYKSLYYLANFGAFLGNEEFYLTFFPFCIWNLDCLIVRQVGILWCLVMYLGQATKDYLRWPRPPCPPVIRLETHYLQEYSMPSTHAMAGTAIPLYMAYLVVERYQVPVPIAVTVALLWFSITCMSRLYLGVHTVLDLTVGCGYAILVFFTFLRYVEAWDYYLQTKFSASFVLLITALALCTICYPSNYKNSSKGDAVQIVAAVTGCILGCWLGCQLGLMHEPEIVKPYTITMPTLSWVAIAMLRFVTGVGMVGGMHFVAKYFSVRAFSYLYGLDTIDKTHPGVITSYKFFTYTVVGATISLFIPLVHLFFGVHRSAMFYEVL